MIKDGRAVLLIHVPKAAGTTAERLFKRSGWQVHYHETRKTNPELAPLRRCAPQHHHAAVLSEVFNLRRIPLSVAVVREPIARFRSEFAMRNRRLDEAPADVVSAWADIFLARYAANPYALDNHLRPQAEFPLPGTEVYRLEDGLDEMVTDLNTRYDLGLPTRVTHRLRSETRGLSSSAVEISPELRARLQEFYAEDYARFGYPLS